MKPIIVTLMVFSILAFLCKPVFAADTYWDISSFDSKIVIQDDGKVDVLETITAAFGSNKKHGIFRTIPVTYTTTGAALRYTNIEFKEVLADSAATPFKISTKDGYITAKIGDPGKTLSGTHVYTIHYRVSGILNHFSDHEELYWNVVGTHWDVPVMQTSASVDGTKEDFLGFKCYVGPTGSTNPCETNGFTNSFKTTFTLGQNSDMSIVASLKLGSVPIERVNSPQNTNFSSGYTFWNTDQVDPLAIGLAGLIASLGVLIPVYLWWKKGRDMRFRTPTGENSQEEIEPIFHHDTVVVEYTAPENLRPAEIAVLLYQNSQPAHITATLIDLASRGYIKIIEKPKSWLLGSKDYIFESSKDPDEKLLEYEKTLLDELFSSEGSIDLGSGKELVNHRQIELSKLKKKFYKSVKKVQDKIYEDLTAKGYFVENPDKIRNRYIGIGIVFLLVSVFGFNLLKSFGINLAILFSSFTPAAVLLIIFSFFMPRRSAKGHEIYLRCQGFRLFISKAENYRQQFFEKQNMFNDMLPYAIMFGLTKKFIKAFKEMGLEQVSPAWYVGAAGVGTFDADSFASSMSSFASMSYSSGVSGGGGAGGGGGGGGGGGW